MADRYHNPDPLIRLIGPVNESTVILEGKEYPALLDSGAQPSGISLKLARKLGLKIYQLDTLLDIEGWGGNEVPYLGYVEVRLQVKEISGMNEDSLFLVVPDSNYTRRVPISIGTVHIERCLQLLKKEEIPNLTLGTTLVVDPEGLIAPAAAPTLASSFSASAWSFLVGGESNWPGTSSSSSITPNISEHMSWR